MAEGPTAELQERILSKIRVSDISMEEYIEQSDWALRVINAVHGTPVRGRLLMGHVAGEKLRLMKQVVQDMGRQDMELWMKIPCPACPDGGGYCECCNNCGEIFRLEH